MMYFIAVLTSISAISSVAQDVNVYDCATGDPEVLAPVPPPNPAITPDEVAKILSEIPIHCDADGLIVGKNTDGTAAGGDTAQREGWYWFGVKIYEQTFNKPWPNKRRLNFDRVLALLEKGNGVFYRHPKFPQFNNLYDKEYGFSRDQMIPLVAAMGVWGKKETIKRLWDALPEDLLGKHSFNGNYRNFLGQDGQDCMAIKKRGCDATDVCTLNSDTRDCSLKVDTRDCSLQEDRRDCSLQVDTRSCGQDINLPFNGRAHINDHVCETAKATQNGLYATQKANCEAAKATQNAAYVAAKQSCETGKATQNGLYASQKAACEAGKAGQNAIYANQKAACETVKTGKKWTCEAQKAIDQVACFASNVHSGDLIGPAAVNLFRRALNENPLVPVSSLTLPPVDIATGELGESELAVNVGIRIGSSSTDMDNVGDDLNLIVQLAMAKLRFPTPKSLAATSLYATHRFFSYGSYFVRYYQQYGGDPTDTKARVQAGIAGQQWTPDVNGPWGAMRWYHRIESGGNPQLAELYAGIVAKLIR